MSKGSDTVVEEIKTAKRIVPRDVPLVKHVYRVGLVDVVRYMSLSNAKKVELRMRCGYADQLLGNDINNKRVEIYLKRYYSINIVSRRKVEMIFNLLILVD